VNVAGLILAAGRSSRMGSPKALLKLRGETFLDNLIAIFREYCDPVVVVLGHDAEVVRAGIRRAEWARIVVNADYSLGQLSSLQCGLRALPSAVDGGIFTPVDYPNIASETVRRLAVSAGSSPICVPRYRGKRGHPVCFRSELIPEFLALASDSQAREIIHRYAERTCYVDVEDPGILDDIDDVEAYARLLRMVEPR
jgi:molybdenum cofactor cytidylyltransferase